MPNGMINRSIGKVAERVPGVRRIPIVALLSAAELAVLARDHAQRLTPDERRRLAALMRAGRGRPSRLGETEQAELEELVTRLAPREWLGTAVDRLSPVPLPHRLTHGRR